MTHFSSFDFNFLSIYWALYKSKNLDNRNFFGPLSNNIGVDDVTFVNSYHILHQLKPKGQQHNAELKYLMKSTTMRYCNRGQTFENMRHINQ